MSSRIPFTKPPTTPECQVQLLRSRGMAIEDEHTAVRFLENVNYYRFCGYALHFEIFENRTRTHQYKKGSSFNDVCTLYEFDSELRTLLFSSIEHIEVAFRTAVCLELCLGYNDSHWYLKKDVYNLSVFSYDVFIDGCRKEFFRSREIFVQSYKDKYSTPELPAAWMLTEVLSIGKWSKIFGGLKNTDDQKAIARRMNATPWHLQSWMHSISYLRNLCAHHCRIWNRTFQIRVNLTKRQKQSVVYPTKMAALCTVMADLLTTLGRKEAFKNQLIELFEKYPGVPILKMGFTDNWKMGAIWR